MVLDQFWLVEKLGLNMEPSVQERALDELVHHAERHSPSPPKLQAGCGAHQSLRPVIASQTYQL